MNREIKYPNDVLNFGKHKGKTIQYVIENDKSYFNWMKTENFIFSELITSLENGVDPIQTRIIPRVKSKSNLLLIEKQSFYILPKLKFVRKNDKIRRLESEILGEFKIDIPYTIEKVKRSRSWLGDGMQQDDINCYSEWFEDVKKYQEPQLTEFINEKLNVYQNQELIN